jgi:hypothetical protein
VLCSTDCELESIFGHTHLHSRNRMSVRVCVRARVCFLLTCVLTMAHRCVINSGQVLKASSLLLSLDEGFRMMAILHDESVPKQILSLKDGYRLVGFLNEAILNSDQL